QFYHCANLRVMPRLITASMGTQAHGGHCFAVRLPRAVSAENHETNRLVAADAAAQFRACIRTSSVPGGGRGNSGHANLPKANFLVRKPTTLRVLGNRNLSTDPTQGDSRRPKH